MKRWLFDSNCLKEPYKHFAKSGDGSLWIKYTQWLAEKNLQGEFYSNTTMRGELEGVELASLKEAQQNFFIVPPTARDVAQSAMSGFESGSEHINPTCGPLFENWAVGKYSQAQVREFYRADFILVDHAHMSDLSVVTLEHISEQDHGRIKIPNFCKVLDIECLHLLELLAREGVTDFIDKDLVKQFRKLEVMRDKYEKFMARKKK